MGVPTLADLCLVDIMTWDGEVRRIAARHADPARQPLADRLRDEYVPDLEGLHPSVQVLRTGRVSWSHEMTDEFLQRRPRTTRTINS